MKNGQIKRNLTEKHSLNSASSPESSPLKHPSKTVDEENLKREKFDLLRESFKNNNNKSFNKNSYLRDDSASKLFDNQINNIDHAFITTKNENFVNSSILFRSPEEIQKDILDKLLKDYDYQFLEKEISLEEEKLNFINKDRESLKGQEDLYGVRRGVCSLCRLECKGFQPDIVVNFINSEKYPGLCLSCGCGASNHVPAEEKLSFFPQEILNLAVNSVLIESNLNFNSILVLFEIEKSGNNSDNNDNKINKNSHCDNFSSSNENIFNLIQLLKDAGFVINANSIQKINEESDIYRLKSNIRSFYRANAQKNEFYEEKNKYEKLVENEDNNSKNILTERKFSLNKFDLVKYFLKDNLDEDRKFIEKVRDNTLDKTLRRVSENKMLGISNTNNFKNNNNNVNGNLNQSNVNSSVHCYSELNYKVNPKFAIEQNNLNNNSNSNGFYNNAANLQKAASELLLSSPHRLSKAELSELARKAQKNSFHSSGEENNSYDLPKNMRSNSNLNYAAESDRTRSFLSPSKSKKKHIQSSVEFENNFFAKFQNEILALTISINYQVNVIDFFERFVLSCRKMFPQNLKLIYYSKSKINALWDVQVLFPDLFKIKYFISVVTEKPDFYDTKYAEYEKNKTLQFNNSMFKTSNKFFAIKNNIENKAFLNANTNTTQIDNANSNTNNNFFSTLDNANGHLRNLNADSLNELQQRNYSTYDNFAINFGNQDKGGLRVPPDPQLINNILNKQLYKENSVDFSNGKNIYLKNNADNNSNNKTVEKSHSLFDPSYSKTIKNNSNYDKNTDPNFNKNKHLNVNKTNNNLKALNNSENLSSGCSSDSYFESSNAAMRKMSSRAKTFKQLFSRYFDFQTSKGIIINKKIIQYEKIGDLIQKLSLFDDFTFIKNFANFISKNAFNESLNCSILFNSYIGSSELISTVSDNNLDVLNISKSRDIELISNIFFQEVIEYNHISIVMRPYIVRSGISEIILNIFKLNNFQILKRKLQVLSKPEAELLFKYEKLNENFKDYYVKMMTDSNSEIVLLGKFGAMSDSKILCNGSFIDKSSKNNTSLIDLLDLNFELELKNDFLASKNFGSKSQKNDFYPQRRKKEKFNSIPTYNSDTNLFHNFNDLINFDFIIKKIIDKIISKFNSSINNPHRYANLLELRKKFLYFSHSFNICMFIPQQLENPQASKTFDFDYINKHEIEKHFFPEFSDIQEALVIIKPDPTEKHELNDYVKITLYRMNFEILDAKKIRLNELEISNLFEKYFHFISTWDYSQNRESFLEHDCEVIRVVKSGCMLELQNILGKENCDFFKDDGAQKFSIFEDKLKILRQSCYLLYNSQESEYFYQKLNEKISKIEGNYLLNFPENVEVILNSCLKNTIAEQLRQDADTPEPLINRYLRYFHFNTTENCNLGLSRIITQYMFAKKEKLSQSFPKNFENFFTLINLNNDLYNSNINFFMETENSGFFEIRIPYLQSYIINPSNLASENMINLDINKMQLTKFYHYLTENFYNQLEEKFNNNDIIIDLAEFDYLLKSENELYSVCNNTESVSARLFKKTKYEINKAFYKFCADNYLNITPQTYHYRIKPEDIDIDISRIYEVEEFQGLLFLDVVSQDYLGYSDKEAFQDFSYKNINEKLLELKNLKNKNFGVTNNSNINKNTGVNLGITNNNNTNQYNQNLLDFEKYSNKKLKLAEYYEMALKNIHQSKGLYSAAEPVLKEEEQYSLSSFLWGRKLAKLCKKFEALLEKREEELLKANEALFDKNLEKRINQNMPQNFKTSQTSAFDNNLNKATNQQTNLDFDNMKKSKESFLGFNFQNLNLFESKPDNIVNCGPLFFSLREAKIKGIVVERFLCEYDQYLYVNILHDLKLSQDSNLFETEIFSEKDFDLVENKLLDVLNSKAFVESRISKHLTLVPARLKENNLRINRKIPYEKFKEHIMNDANKIINNDQEMKNTNPENANSDKHSKPKHDPLQSNFNNPHKRRRSSLKITKLHNYFKSAIYEKTNQTSGKFICLSDVNCMKASVFRYYAAFLFMLKIYYKKLDRKTYLLGKLEGINVEDEYDKMLDAIIFGLNNFIDLDARNDENGFNCYKNEYFLFLISEIKFNLNELKNLQKIQKEIEAKLIIQREYHNLKGTSGNRNSMLNNNFYNNNYSVNANNNFQSNLSNNDNHNNMTTEQEYESRALKEEFMTLENLLPKIKKEISDINMNIEIIFYELKNYDLKHRVMRTEEDNKLISLNKETYHIPMYNPEKWEKDLTNERFIHTKVLNRGFLMTKEYLNFLKNKNPGNIPIKQIQQKAKLEALRQAQNNSMYNNSHFSSLGMQAPNKLKFFDNIAQAAKSNPHQFVYATNMLRKPETEISKEILIEKQKKEIDKKHPIKYLASTLRSKMEDN